MTRSSARFRVGTALAALCVTATALSAHDMFWRLTSFFIAPNSAVQLPVLNGTFSKSENSIDWSRVADLSVVSPSRREPQDSAHWDTKTHTSRLAYRTGASGTYVAGLSTKPRDFSLKAAEFNKYLADDGIPDVLAARRSAGILSNDARERYSKHIKAIFQVGDTRTDGWRDALGYPAEIVPLDNPYSLSPGQSIRVRCLVDGKPIANQLVQTGGRLGMTGDQRMVSHDLRTDADGVATVPLDKAGRWYVKFIRMVPMTDGKVDYESKWATLTFEVRGKK